MKPFKQSKTKVTEYKIDIQWQMAIFALFGALIAFKWRTIGYGILALGTFFGLFVRKIECGAK